MNSPSLFNNAVLPAGIPLSQYTAAISKIVNSSGELSGAWVIAELSDVRVSGGHCYMELIEKNDSGQTIAKLRATIWQSTFSQLRRKFYQATGKDISTGIKALVKGSANHHSIYGLAFNISDIDPSYTLGDIERIRQEILLKLSKEGIINLNKTRNLSPAPQRIAVISAEGAAGYGDFMNQLLNNREGFVFYPVLFPCVMQGDRISSSIRNAIELIEASADLWDCIVIVRGGGATTDMNGFDDYQLARAVATCALPVVVGIGHDRDRNVLDDIAHTSLKTPTAVAAFFIDRIRTAYDSILLQTDKLRQAISDKMRGEERRLATLESLFPQLALRRLADHESRLKTISDKLPIIVSARLGKENTRLESKWELGASAAVNAVSKAVQKVRNIENMLKILDPANTLRRGYSITRVDGKALKDPSLVKPGILLTTELRDGKIISRVSEE